MVLQKIYKKRDKNARSTQILYYIIYRRSNLLDMLSNAVEPYDKANFGDKDILLGYLEKNKSRISKALPERFRKDASYLLPNPPQIQGFRSIIWG